MNIEPGIYRHFKGNLYYVLGIAMSGNDPTNEERMIVQYHPLYLVENIGWMYRTVVDFCEVVIREKYFGPRFVKISECDLPIGYGKKLLRRRFFGNQEVCVVVRVFESENNVIAEIDGQYRTYWQEVKEISRNFTIG